MLGMKYRWRDSRLWSDSLIYLGINAGVVLVAAVLVPVVVFFLAYFVGSFVRTPELLIGLIVAALVILALLVGLPSILLFVRRQRRELGVSGGRAAWAYIVVVLVANFAYLALAFGYAALAGAI